MYTSSIAIHAQLLRALEMVKNGKTQLARKLVRSMLQNAVIWVPPVAAEQGWGIPAVVQFTSAGLAQIIWADDASTGIMLTGLAGQLKLQ